MSCPAGSSNDNFLLFPGGNVNTRTWSCIFDQSQTRMITLPVAALKMAAVGRDRPNLKICIDNTDDPSESEESSDESEVEAVSAEEEEDQEVDVRITDEEEEEGEISLTVEEVSETRFQVSFLCDTK